jgi:probable F420-dependent oxidoreductase
VTTVATRAEALGYDSLWTIERLLYPIQPQSPYPGMPDGVLPEPYKHCLDPLETLTFAAAQTTRVGLGTSVIDMLYYNPVMLARRLSTLDCLSHGRLRVGLGLGWSKDEFAATGANWHEWGARADEFLAVLQAIWTSDPVEFQGQFYRIPKSIIQPKPVQKPYPPLYLAAFAPPALRRQAQWADGWNPAGLPLDGMRQQFDRLKHMAAAAGRDPAALQMVVRPTGSTDRTRAVKSAGGMRSSWPARALSICCAKASSSRQTGHPVTCVSTCRAASACSAPST